MREKFSFDIEARRMHNKKVILTKGLVESREHVAMKLLAYILYYDSELKIEVEVGMHYKPDLVKTDEEGKPVFWVDCGHVSPKKAESLSKKLKHTRLVFVKESKSAAINFKRLIGKRNDACERIEFCWFDSQFVKKFAKAFEKTNELTVYPIDEESMGFVINETVLESGVYTT